MASISSTTIRRRGSRDPLRHGDPAIIGWRNPQWEFIVNPIVDLGFGSRGDIDFVPAARLARTLSKDLAFGWSTTPLSGGRAAFLPFEQQAHQLFAVVDFKIGDVDVDFGLATG